MASNTVIDQINVIKAIMFFIENGVCKFLGYN